MSDDLNPYQSPGSIPSPASGARPKSPTVFGILCLVFGGFGLIGSLSQFVLQTEDLPPEQIEVQEMMGFGETYLQFATWVGLLFILWLLATGVGLLRYQDWGRVSFNWYAWINIVWTIGTAIYMIVNLLSFNRGDPVAIGMAVGMALGSLVGLLFPILGLVYLNRQAVRQALA